MSRFLWAVRSVFYFGLILLVLFGLFGWYATVSMLTRAAGWIDDQLTNWLSRFLS